MKFEIKNRWTGGVQFECELTAEVAGLRYGLQLGFAIKKAYGADADLRDADLTGAILTGADLRDADLTGAILRGAILRGAVLTGAVLRDAILTDAILTSADLRDADLRGADWIPRIPDIHKTILTAASAPDAFDMRSWHNACGTAHCRAGWVVKLAGAAGKVMEGVYGTPAAAALIYQASDPTLEKVPDFYCDNETAMADMKRLARVE